MILDDEQTRIAYYVASEILRSRRRLGQPIPQWLFAHYKQLDAAYRGMSPRRHDGPEIGADAPQSGHADLMGTRQVADMLGLSARQVRCRADQLGGVRVCGRLLFMRESVVNYRKRSSDG
jgi:hypothetical protein